MKCWIEDTVSRGVRKYSKSFVNIIITLNKQAFYVNNFSLNTLHYGCINIYVILKKIQGNSYATSVF